MTQHTWLVMDENYSITGVADTVETAQSYAANYARGISQVDKPTKVTSTTETISEDGYGRDIVVHLWRDGVEFKQWPFKLRDWATLQTSGIKYIDSTNSDGRVPQ